MGWRARPSAHKSPESNPGLTYQTQEGGGLAAKDGTNCGGRRVRAGAKPDPLKDKLEVGKPASRLLEPADLDPFGLDGVDMGEGAVLDGEYYARTFRLPVRDTALPPRDSSRCPVGFASKSRCGIRPGCWTGHVCTLRVSTRLPERLPTRKRVTGRGRRGTLNYLRDRCL